MGSTHVRRALAPVLAIVLAISLAACGGGPGGAANDPAGVVSAAIAAAQSGGIGKLADYACAAHKNDIAGAFGGGNLGALSTSGVKPEDIYGAVSMTFANVTTKEVTKSDKAATVHVTGDMTINIDKEKFKAIVKAMSTAQGLPADDATIDAMVSGMATQLSTTRKLDEDINVVNEGGKWLICG
jgi:ribosomal protein L25 (general stress protein Ctc)